MKTNLLTMKNLLKNIFTLSFSIFIVFYGNAQEENLKKEVFVIKPYEPVISDAFKVNKFPELKDTLRINPSFDYSILPTALKTDFELMPIKPAKMVGQPISELYKSYLKLGLGNHHLPYAEFFSNSLRSKEYNFGIHIKHVSTKGKVKLENDARVSAGDSKTGISLFGKKIYNKVVLNGNAGINQYKFPYYGYNTDTIYDPAPKRKDILQTDHLIYTNFNLKSIENKSNNFRYNLTAGNHYFMDKNNNAEHLLNFGAKLDQIIKTQEIQLGLDIKHLIPSEKMDTVNQTLLQFNPLFKKSKEEWRIELGLNAYMHRTSGESEFYFFPDARLEFDIVKSILTPFLGIKGDASLNSYHSLFKQNPFIKISALPALTKNDFIAYGGLKGNFSQKISYNIGVSASRVNNMILFVNDTVKYPGNSFLYITDNVDVTRFFSEINFMPSEHFEIRFQAAYQQFLTEKEREPWHQPVFYYSSSLRYNLKNKILANFEIFGKGKRYARPLEMQDDPIELNPYINLNLGLEYRYNNVFSIFMDIQNMSASSYSEWNQYPVLGFSAILGFTYAL